LIRKIAENKEKGKPEIDCREENNLKDNARNDKKVTFIADGSPITKLLLLHNVLEIKITTFAEI